MAFALDTYGTVSVQFEDEGKSRTNHRISIPIAGATTITALEAFATAYANACAALSDSKVDRYTVSFSAFDNAAVAATAGSNIEKKAVLLLETAAGKTVKYAIPDPIEGVLDANKIDIDLAATEMAALVTLLTTGDGTIVPVDTNGSDIAAAKEAYQYHRQSLYGTRKRKG
jgi:hypothetical protein